MVREEVDRLRVMEGTARGDDGGWRENDGEGQRDEGGREMVR